MDTSRKTVLIAALLTLTLAPPVQARGAGPLLRLTELMVNPSGPDDDAREWIEILNAGDVAAPLAEVGLTIARGDSRRDLVLHAPSGAHLAPGSYLVVGGRNPARDATSVLELVANSALVPSALSLANDGASVTLTFRGEIADQVVYGEGAIPVPAGASLNREPHWEYGSAPPWSSASPVAGGSWCAARTAWAEGSDLGTPGAQNVWCDDDGDGFAEDQGDCDDADDGVSPWAAELCDGRDNDCDGETDEAEELVSNLSCLHLGVCDGVIPACDGEAGWRCPYPEGYERDEASCDGRDNDCDGETDEGLRNRCGRCGALELDRCNGLDDDCDGETDEDAGREGRGAALCLSEGVCAGAVSRCAGLEGWLCDYAESFEPGEELSCDGLDNDCDGETDEPFSVGSACVSGQGACAAAGALVCTEGGGVACTGRAGDPQEERCGDGVDNDCDGETDEGFTVGEDCAVGQGACLAWGKRLCTSDGLDMRCSASPGPAGVEYCGDGVDGDCDGETDEAGCVVPPASLSGRPVGCSGGAGGSAAPLGGLLLLLLLWFGVELKARPPGGIACLPVAGRKREAGRAWSP